MHGRRPDAGGQAAGGEHINESRWRFAARSLCGCWPQGTETRPETAERREHRCLLTVRMSTEQHCRRVYPKIRFATSPASKYPQYANGSSEHATFGMRSNILLEDIRRVEGDTLGGIEHVAASVEVAGEELAAPTRMEPSPAACLRKRLAPARLRADASGHRRRRCARERGPWLDYEDAVSSRGRGDD